MNKNTAARIIQREYRRRKTAHLTLYNGTVDFGFPLNIKALFEEVIARKNPIVRRVSVINASFKDVRVWTKETGIFGASEPTYHGMRVMMYYKGRNHNFVMFRSGKIQYSGGYPISAVVGTSVPYSEWFTVPAKVFNIALARDMLDVPDIIKESRDEGKDPMGLNNVTLQAQPVLRIPVFRTLMAELVTKFTHVEQEPEMFAFIKFKHLGVSFRIMNKGVVQVSGIHSPKDVPKIIEFIYGDLAILLRAHATARKVNKVEYTKSRPVNNYRKATTCPSARCPVPYTFDGVCPEMKDASGKVIKTFIAPTKSGFPCCYAVPKKLDYRRNALIKQFRNLGIKIPQSTRNAFGIQNTGSPVHTNLPKNASGYKFSNTGKTGNVLLDFKIGSRQCGRHTLKELSHIAAVMHLHPSIVKLRSKEELCKAIRSIAKLNTKKENSPGMPRIGGRRCDTFTKSELKLRAKNTFGLNLNTSMTLKEMCEDIKTRRAPPSNNNNWIEKALMENARRAAMGKNRSPNR